jgi:hypothetical protein
MKLKFFNDPDESFYAKKLDPAKEEYNLEEGDQFIFGYEIVDKNEFNHWIWSQGNLINTNEPPDKVASIDYKKLSKAFAKFEKLTYMPAWTYPSGRAFLAFESVKSEIPKDIDISIIAGLNESNNWNGVIIKGYDSLVNLQSFLEENDMKVNFEVTENQ